MTDAEREQPWPLTTAALPEVQLQDHGVRLRSGAIFSALTGYRPLRLDLYLPPVTRSPAPLVVWIHGGAFWHGDRTALPPLLEQERLFTRLPLAGFAVASVEYRLSSEAHFPAQLEDVQAAIRWLRARHAELGSTRGGWQRGANRRAATWPPSRASPGRSVRLVRRSISGGSVRRADGRRRLVRPDRFRGHGPPSPGDSQMCHDDPDSPESRLIGAPVQERPDLVARADPCRWVTADAPPFLIMHGTRDRLVPIGQSEQLAARLRELGVPVDFRAVEGADHVFLDDERGPGLVDEVVAFLVRTLRPGS